MEVLDNIVWVFDKVSYNSYAEFNKVIRNYQIEILGKDTEWNAGKIIINNPSVEISYEYYEGENDVVFEDETELLFEDDFAQDKLEEDALKRIVKAKFTADNKEYFTALELLFKIHQRLISKDLGADIFFEGLASIDNSELFDPPLLFVILGS